MGTQSIPERTDGQTIYDTWFNVLRSVLAGDHVPRNTSGNPTSLAGSVGSITYPWNVGYFNSLNVGGESLDTSLFAASPNRIVSGKEKTSGYPDFLTPAGSGNGLTGTISATATNLVTVIDSASVTVTQDIVTSAQTAAPTSNNTCTVNDPTMNDGEVTKYVGEFGFETIAFDAGGSELDTLSGSVQPFQHGSGPEIFLGYLTSSSGVGTIRPFLRGIGGTKREEIADNDTITLLKAAYIFLEDDGTTLDISYQFPTWAQASPTGPVAGQYWYDMTNQTWKRYSGATWEDVDRTYLGSFVNDGTDVLYAEPEPFTKGFKDTNGMKITYLDAGTLRIHNGSYLDIAGSNRYWEKDIDIALSTNLDEGAEASSTRYWLYVDDDGQFYFSIQRPRIDYRERVRYHPYQYWRAVYTVYNDASSNIDPELDKSFYIQDEGLLTDPELRRIIEKDLSVKIDDVERIRTNKILESGYLDNTTNVYAHHLNGIASQKLSSWLGSQNMSIGAGALLNGLTNPLGESGNFCQFDGSTWLKNTTITVGNDPDFTWWGWVYLSNWNDNLTRNIVTEENGANGWLFYKSSGNNLVFLNRSTASVEIQVTSPNLSSGWHHIFLSRSHGNNSMIGIDGNIRAYNNIAASITAAGDYELGSQNGGGSRLVGGLWDVGIDTDTAYNANQYRKLFSASAKKPVYIDGNSKVSINDGRRNNGHYRIVPPSDLTGLTSTTPAILTGWRIYFPENGEYTVKPNFTFQLLDQNNNGVAQCIFYLYKNGVLIPNTRRDFLFDNVQNDGGGDIYFENFYMGSHTDNFEKDDYIDVYYQHGVAGDELSVYQSSNRGFIEWEKKN